MQCLGYVLGRWALAIDCQLAEAAPVIRDHWRNARDLRKNR